jgi:exonuclease-1
LLQFKHAFVSPQVLYKLDRSGHGEEICLADLPRNKGVSFANFNHNMFLEVCAAFV